MNSAVFVMALVILVIYWNGSNPIGLDEHQQAMLDLWANRTQHELQRVNDTALDAPLDQLNLTGIGACSNASDLNPFIPKPLEHRLGDIWAGHSAHGALYHNISSILHGTFTSIAHTDQVDLDLSYFNETLDNYTLGVPQAGKVALFVKETIELNNTQLLQAELELADGDPVVLRGVYTGGYLVMATNTLKFSGVGAIPWITPSTQLEDARNLLLESLSSAAVPTYSGFLTSLENSRQCEWVLWGRVKSVPLDEDELQKIEKELESPKGRPTRPAPDIELEAVLYSPDCAASFSMQAQGMRREKFRQRLRHALVLLLGLFIAAHTLTVFQVIRINTPTANFRVSFWTVAINTLTDGLVCMSCMLATYEKSFALQLMAIVVEVFCFITIIQLDYLVGIFQAQLAPGSDLSQQQIASLVYARLYMVLLCLCLLSVSSYSFTEAHRSAYEWVIFVGLFSNWWPQVWRNVRRGISRPFRLSYVYGISVLRLTPILYICFYPDNVCYHHYDPTLGWVLIGWQWLQVGLLSAQYALGGQFFLPERWCSHIYDYHPVVTGDLETLLQDPECAICMSPVALVTSNSPSELLARRKYMITPCRHVFHTDCLEEWIKRKLECPVCRTALPCS